MHVTLARNFTGNWVWTGDGGTWQLDGEKISALPSRTRYSGIGRFSASALVGAGSDAIIMRNPSRPKPAADWRSSARRGSCLAS